MNAKPCLLIVADHQLAETISPDLLGQDWVKRSCGSVQQAINIGTYHRIGALLIDMRLPDGRGDTVFWYLSATYHHLHSRTLFLVHNETDIEAADAAKCPWLQLPADDATIQDALRKATAPKNSASRK